MSKIAYLVLLLAGNFYFGIIQAQWDIEKSPTKNNLNAIFFSSSNSGWIVGDKGTILKKSNSGWVEYQTPTSENLYSVFIVDNNDGWAVGAKGTIIHFNGKNWEVFDSPTKKNLFSVSFKDSKNGIAVGGFGTVVLYKNGKWSLLENSIRGDLFTTDFKNDEAWFGGGLECVKVPIMKILSSKDENKIVSSLNSFASIHSMTFINPENGWAVGSPSIVMHFDGRQWNTLTINERFSSLKSVFFLDENNGISVGFGGTILTFSGGEWIKENTCVIQNLNGVAIIDKTCYAIGDNGTIIVKNQAANNNATIPEQPTGKIQLYPNPCDEFVNIVFSLENYNSTGLISITNSYGLVFLQRTFKLENENYVYPIETKSLKNGLYILKTFIGGKMITNKFIISH